MATKKTQAPKKAAPKKIDILNLTEAEVEVTPEERQRYREELAPPVMLNITPEEYVRANYGHFVVSQNLPGLLAAILTEVVKTRMGR